MTNFQKLIGGASLLALGLASAPAMAATASTAAGTVITNNVSVAFNVGGVSQTAATGSNSFVVDRKVNLSVSGQESAPVEVVINQSGRVKFTVTNASNGPLDIALAAINTGSGTGTFTATGLAIYKQATGGTAVTYLDNVAADTPVDVWVQGTAVQGTDGDLATIKLTATAHSPYGVAGPQYDSNTKSIAAPTTDGVLGPILTDSTGSADVDGIPTSGTNATIQNVFFDDDGVTGTDRHDGKSYDNEQIKRLNAALVATKASLIVKDPVNGTTNAKAIPGATLRYCITVNNSTGNADATSVVVSDTLPGDVSYAKDGIKLSDGSTLTDFGVLIGDTCSSVPGDYTTPVTGSESAGTITANVGTVEKGKSKAVIFHATIK